LSSKKEVQPDTKSRILDAAEHLFADRGFADTSMRRITTEAGANLAAVHYHFGSKEQLIDAVLARRLGPLNEARLAGLRRAEAEAGPAGAPVEALLVAFIAPALQLREGTDRGSSIVRLLGQCLNQPDPALRRKVLERFREVFDRFSAALSRALPHLDPADVRWRLLFTIGSMAHMMSMSDDLFELSGGLCDPEDTQGVLKRLVAFVAAGLEAPA